MQPSGGLHLDSWAAGQPATAAHLGQRRTQATRWDLGSTLRMAGCTDSVQPAPEADIPAALVGLVCLAASIVTVPSGGVPALLQNPGREASLRELLANLQADLEQLQFSAAAGDSSDASCSASGLSGSAATPEDAGCVQAGQLQQQLAKLTQNCAELGEAVLQLDLQMQQVGPACARARSSAPLMSTTHMVQDTNLRVCAQHSMALLAVCASSQVKLYSLCFTGAG